ncbi:penicillin acylase family protein [Adhaeretor mobilis]|uniref:Acyl-homoserine lactone acylase QuiP n=1 Tax=Adhaeretor mobilis TaxID=1930276 RepID=A0A517MS77_9BACT|nr:penicillin acylase family protein [Adhaeretor mobilis]QDS97740.1 Acyl-homoserine lactone acylase QuiP precursor [Adhaeretor mobilis]
MEPISTKAAKCEFTAVRDEHGTPHVTAPTWQEAIYALGFLHATDRPTQIFFSRTIASGQAAERIADKPELVETDRFFRRAGLHLGIESDADLLRPDIRQQLDWYCEGVNDALQDASRSLPMLVTGFHPRPWNPSSVLLIGNLLSFAGLAVGEQENERLLVDLVQTGVKPELLRELFGPYLDDVDLEVLKEVNMERRLSDDALEMLVDLPRLAGSNAWAVSPRRSATDHALLASDPHLEINRLPAIWYEVALHWGNEKEGTAQYAMGATLPGCPLMAVGRTEKLAWGVTYLHADTSDFFIEDCRRKDGRGKAKGGEDSLIGSHGESEESHPDKTDPSEIWQYRRTDAAGDDQWHDFRVRDEPIHRKGDETLHYQVFENDQGTLGRDLTGGEPGKYLSASWIGSAEGAGKSIGCWLDVIHSESTREAMEVVKENPHPSLVWVLADKQGHIGRQASGWLPQRAARHTGVVPVPAWNAENHWRGIQPSDHLPSLFDPPEGYVVSANEDLNRAGEWHINTHRLADYRKRRIVEVLHENRAVTVEDMQALQYDILSLQARDLLPVLLPHVPEGNLKESLVNWDLRYTPESTAATRFQHLYRHVLLEIFGHETGIGWRRMFYLATRIGYSSMVLTAIDGLLKRQDSLWWDGRDKHELIRCAAEAASAEEAHPWGEVNSFHFANRYFEKSRVGRMLGFHTDRMPMPGCQATPFQGHLMQTATRESSFAPSYHFVAELGTDEAWTNLPGGASESRFSKWYKNDIERWAAGEYRRLKAIASE